MLEKAEYDEKSNVFKLPVSIEEVTRELQKAYGSGTLEQDKRSVEFPQQKWVRNAFEKLVELKMALPPTTEQGSYQILYKRLRGDILERFAKLVLSTRTHGKGAKPPDPAQMPLFVAEENGE